MLIVPTSLDTAILLGMDSGWMPVWSAVDAATFIFLAAYAYCGWEMLISLLGKSRPRRSRWAWLAVTGVLLISAIIVSDLVVGPVTFNAGQADWISTSWGSVIGQYCVLAFDLCALVLLVMRVVDAIRIGRTGRLPYSVWRLLAFLVTMAYGFLLVLHELQVYGLTLEYAVLVIGFGLTVLAVGSLAAAAVISRMRGDGAPESASTSV